MRRIKDTLVIGLIAGLGANLVKESIGETMIRSGVTKYSCRRMIPMIIVDKKNQKNWKGQFLGTTTDMTVAGLTGILIAEILAKTGKEYGLLKGIMVGNGLLDQVFNVFSIILPEVRKDPLSNIVCRGIHSVYGALAASIILRIADPSIFKKNETASPRPEQS